MKTTSEQITIKADLPHLRNGGNWSLNSEPKKRMKFYLKRLIDLGMPESEAQCMMSDLYWDCFLELKANRK